MATPTTSSTSAAGPSATAWPGRQIFSGFLVAQALVGIGLWVLMAVAPDVRAGFELDENQPAVMDAFVFADLFVIVLGSVACARLLWRGSPAAVPMVAFLAGAIVYPTLFLVGWVALVGTGSLCLVIMVPPSILTCWVAWQTWRALR
jgi:hypothetical protein